MSAAPSDAQAVVAAGVTRDGPLRFDTFIEIALYGEGCGFFARGGGAGRRRDFVTSPEVGPLFGAVLARALDRWWRELGEPDPYWVVEAGAGRGALAHAVLAAGPACGQAALRYVCVERAALLGDQARELLPPAVEVVPELPAGPVTGVILANELLDNLPFRVLERTAEGWDELHVDVGTGGDLVELLRPASGDVATVADRLTPAARPGARIPVQDAAAHWLAEALGRIAAGRAVLIDYCSTTAELAARPWTDWVRTFRSHDRGGHPLDAVGEQDVTAVVATDQLARVRPPTRERTQAEFLAEHGIDELVAEARAAWHDRAHIGDLQALEARSRVGEADALTDPAGLGAHKVLEFVVPG